MGYPLLAPIYPVTSIFWEWRPEIHHMYLTHPTSFDIFISNDWGSWVDIIGILFPLLRKALYVWLWALSIWLLILVVDVSKLYCYWWRLWQTQCSNISHANSFDIPIRKHGCSKTWRSYLPRSVCPREKDNSGDTYIGSTYDEESPLTAAKTFSPAFYVGIGETQLIFHSLSMN